MCCEHCTIVHRKHLLNLVILTADEDHYVEKRSDYDEVRWLGQRGGLEARILRMRNTYVYRRLNEYSEAQLRDNYAEADSIMQAELPALELETGTGAHAAGAMHHEKPEGRKKVEVRVVSPGRSLRVGAVVEGEVRGEID
eukprot:6484869-Amphidinium_carterae.2